MLRENNETETAVYDMLVDVQEKRDRLRRKTVPPAGLNMKVVKIINGCATADDYAVTLLRSAFRIARRTGLAKRVTNSLMPLRKSSVCP